MKKAAIALLSLLVGAAFLYAGWTKWRDPGEFAQSLEAYRLFGPHLVGLIAIVLAPFELFLGMTVLIPRLRRRASFWALALTVCFGLILLQARLRGLDVDCGCFGRDPWRPLRAIPPLIRDLALLLASATLRLSDGS